MLHGAPPIGSEIYRKYVQELENHSQVLLETLHWEETQ